jgi:predicted dehydrogenase
METNIAVIGAGFMGSAHARAYNSIPALYDDGISPRIAWVVDADASLAQRAADAWGAQRWSTDWKEALADPAVQIADICLPPCLHNEVVTAAAEASLAIYCEKPLTTSAADARKLAQLTESRGLSTMIGFNLRWTPAIRYLRELLTEGRLGTIYQFYGHFLADWAADPASWDWRLSRAAAGPGALADVGSHIIDLARFLLGDIEHVQGEATTVIPEHNIGSEKRRTDNDDQFVATTRFTSGALGVISGSRVATGRKVEAVIELTGSAGSARWNLNRLNELQLYLTSDQPLERGFRTILLGPDHPLQRPFSPAHGVGISFLDTKVIEAHAFLNYLASGTTPSPSFRDAWETARLVEQIETTNRANAGH